MDIHNWIMAIHYWIIDIHIRIMDIHNFNNSFMDSHDRRMDILYRAYTFAFPRQVYFPRVWLHRMIFIEMSNVMKIWFCRNSLSGHQNKFSTCLNTWQHSSCVSYAIIVTIGWLKFDSVDPTINRHRLHLNQSKTNCSNNLHSDGIIVREMGTCPECTVRNLLQFFLPWYTKWNSNYQINVTNASLAVFFNHTPKNHIRTLFKQRTLTEVTNHMIWWGCARS